MFRRNYCRNYYRTSTWAQRSKPEKNTDPTIPARLAALASNPNLSVKFADVVASFASAFKKYKGLTSAQYKYMEQIEADVTPQKIAEYAQRQLDKKTWEAGFASNPEKVEKFQVACKYYAAVGTYFSTVIQSVKENPAFIPDERLYSKMCLNKYLSQVYDNYKAEPKYDLGALVKLSVNFNAFKHRPMWKVAESVNCVSAPSIDRNGLFLVIGVDPHPPVSYAKTGTKLYKLVSTDGKSTRFLVQESDIKKLKVAE